MKKELSKVTKDMIHYQEMYRIMWERIEHLIEQEKIKIRGK